MTAGVEAGAKAPDFDLPTSGGKSVRLGALQGRKVVLYFYPKDDTTACTAEAIAFNALRAKFARAGAAIIGVSPDSVKSHERFARKRDLALTLASDETKAMIEGYGLWVEKSMYGRKYMGVERTTFLIDENGIVARVWRKVKTAGHPEEVLDAVKAMGTRLERVNPNAL
jgi:thioredoxin-dependent peroxiredoxin